MDVSTIAPTIVSIVEKLGIIGILLIALYFLVRELMRLRAELSKVYRQRDGARLAVVKLRTTLEGLLPPVKVDLSDLDALLKEDV